MSWNKIVIGENVSQVFHFVKSENADLGFLAYSQVLQAGLSEGSMWEVPQSYYRPIEQQVVLLKKSEAASEFIDFIKSNQIKTLISNYGYEI